MNSQFCHALNTMEVCDWRGHRTTFSLIIPALFKRVTRSICDRLGTVFNHVAHQEMNGKKH